MTDSHMPRRPEPEAMNDAAEAAAYAEADFAAVNQAFVQRLLEVAAPAENARAIDLGTGPADIPIRLALARPSWRITAVDTSQAMLDLAAREIERAGLGAAIDLVRADAKATGLPSGAFDVVFSNSILHHVTDTGAFWAELKRLAAPAATVFLRDLVRPASVEEARRIVRRHAGDESPLLQEEFHRSLLSAYTVDEVRAQLVGAGIAALEVAMSSDRHLDVFGRLS